MGSRIQTSETITYHVTGVFQRRTDYYFRRSFPRLFIDLRPAHFLVAGWAVTVSLSVA